MDVGESRQLYCCFSRLVKREVGGRELRWGAQQRRVSGKQGESCLVSSWCSEAVCLPPMFPADLTAADPGDGTLHLEIL